MKISICIDYDNLSKLQKHAGILDVVTRALHKISNKITDKSGECEVRLYGGWFEDENLSTLSQELSVKIQNDFPTIIKLHNSTGGICNLRVTTELAFSLLEEPGHQLFNTYRRKGKPHNLRIESKDKVGCTDESCPLPMARKLIQKGNCPTLGCSTSGTQLIYRHEQKLVDTMLTCDLIYLAGMKYNFLLLISADDDFLPPIRTLALRGAKIVRVHPTFSSNHRPVRIGGTNLTELAL